MIIQNLQIDEDSVTYDPNTLDRLIEFKAKVNVDELSEASDEELREAGMQFLKQIQKQHYEQD